MQPVNKSPLAKIGVYFIGVVSVSAINFLLIPFYTRQLSMNELGIYSLLETIQQFSVVVVGLGLSHAQLRWFSEKNLTPEKILSSTVIFQMLISSIFVGSFFFWYGSFSKFILDSHPKSFPIIFLLTLIVAMDAVNDVFLSYFRANQQPFKYNVQLLIKALLGATVSIILVSYFRLGVLGAFIGIFSGVFSSFLFAATVSRKLIAPQFDPTLVKKLLFFGLPICVGVFFSQIGVVYERSVVSKQLGLTDLAQYAVVSKLNGVLTAFIIGPVQLALLPMAFSKIGQDSLKFFLQRSFNLYVLGLLIFSGLLITFKPEIFAVICGNKIADFKTGIRVFEFTTFAIFIDALAFFGYLNLRISQKSKFELYGSMINFFFTVLFLYLLLKNYQLWGVVAAKISATFISTFFLHRVSYQSVPIHYNLLSAMVLFVFQSAGISLIHYFVENRIWGLLIQLTWLFSFAYFIVKFYKLNDTLAVYYNTLLDSAKKMIT
jgi:O-antigen/teichoic acid export membrane protein